MAYIGNPAAPTLAQVSDNTITSAKIVDGAIGTADIANDAVTAAKISNTEDFVVNGLTVGKGAGSVATNTAVGASALAANTTGLRNNAFGSQALPANTTGIYNAAFGDRALQSNVGGSYNSAFGLALTANTSGTFNTAIGHSALTSSTTPSYNTAIGAIAMETNTTGANNTALGYAALFSNTTASNNTAVGYQAGYSSTGQRNAFFGSEAGYSNTTGESNTYIGRQAGYLMTTGVNNTIIGRYNGNQGGLDIRTSSNNIVLSDGDGNPRIYVDNSGVVYMNGGSYVQTSSNQNIRFPSTGGIGYVGNTTSATAFQISYNSTSAGVQLTSGATSWGTFSDSRLKNVTGTYDNALADIAQLEPVKFTWKSDTENKPQVGILAQSVQSVVPEAVESSTIEMDGTEEYLTVRYTELIPLMIASIQELSAKVDAQAAEIAALKGQ